MGIATHVSGSEAMLVEVRKLIDRIGIRAGWKAGELGTRVFRHTRECSGEESEPLPAIKCHRGRCSGVGPARLERATSCSGGKRSIQLSYGP